MAMFKRFHLLALLLATVLHLQATTVTSTAGKLSTILTNHDVYSLTVNGTLDARDFLFINDELVHLRILDLTNATIVAYNSTPSDGMLPGAYIYANNTLPYCAFAGMVKLQTVNLPANLTAIDYGAFAGCKALTAINFPSVMPFAIIQTNTKMTLKTTDNTFLPLTAEKNTKTEQSDKFIR